MKEYSFTVENNKGNKLSSNNFEDNILNEMILNNILNKYPYMATKKTYTTPKCPFEKECVFGDITNVFGNPYKTINKNDNFYIYFDGRNFVEGHDDYDFMLNGTPVKDRGQFVQVGYNLIPREYFPTSLYLGGNHRIVNSDVIDIIIKIKNKKPFYIF